MASLHGDGDTTLGDMSLAMLHAPQSFRGPSAYKYNLRDPPGRGDASPRRLREETPLPQQQQQDEDHGNETEKNVLRQTMGQQPLASKVEALEMPVLAFSPRAAQHRSSESPAIKIKKALVYSTTQSYRLAGET